MQAVCINLAAPTCAVGLLHFVTPASTFLSSETLSFYATGLAQIACAVGLFMPRHRVPSARALGLLNAAILPTLLGACSGSGALVWLRALVQLPVAWMLYAVCGDEADTLIAARREAAPELEPLVPSPTEHPELEAGGGGQWGEARPRLDRWQARRP